MQSGAEKRWVEKFARGGITYWRCLARDTWKFYLLYPREFTSIYFNLFCNYYFSMDIYLSTILISRMENKIFYDFVEIDVYTFYIIGYFCEDKLIETYLVILFFFLGYRFKWNTICCLSSSSLKVCGGGE